MQKQDEIDKPDSCFNKAQPNEMMFILLGRDRAAPHVIREWVHERLRLGLNVAKDKQIFEALECARRMEKGE